MNSESVEKVGRMRVVKKLDPSNRGAIKLAEQFGQTLLCVRYRMNERGTVRFTTVELLVGQAPVKAKTSEYVAVQIDWSEQNLRQIVKDAGARWDGKAKVWRMPRRLAGILRLNGRIERA